MSNDTIFTQAMLDALEEAIALGATSVQYGDKKIEYRSIREMLSARDLIRRKLKPIDPCASRIYPRLSKGLKPTGWTGGGGPCDE